jgi:glycosyltransferase involved in cell wall biosynthesis
MRILLVGNHPQDGLHSQSMTIFADLLHMSLTARGHEVVLARPKSRLWALTGGGRRLGKWCKYLEQFLLFPLELRRLERWADVVHICDHSNSPFLAYLAGKPSLVTCHDVIGMKRALGFYPEERAGWLGRRLQSWTARNLRRADRIACVSQTVRRELEDLLHLDAGQLSVVYNGLNYPYTPMDEALAGEKLRTLGVPADRPLILHVGSDEWKKNRWAVLEMFVELRRLNHPHAGHLVFAGAPLSRDMLDYLQEQGLAGDVSAFEKVSSELLCALYSKAALFLFPSLYEGFGWPIIEAQACGCLVATSNRNPMKEVSGLGAIAINPERPRGAARRIAAMSQVEVHRVRQLGRENARRFAPGLMIEGYENLYRALVSAPKNASPATSAARLVGS